MGRRSSNPPSELNSLLRRLMLPIYVPTMIYMAGSSAIIPVVPLVGLRLGLDVPQVALVATIAGVLAVVGPIPTGRAMSRIGERNGLIVGGGIACVALVGCLVAATTLTGTRPDQGPNWATGLFVGSIWLLALGDLTWDLGRQTYLAEEVPAHLRARAMTLFGGTMRIGRLVGPLLGALALSFAGIGSVFVIHLVAALACIVGVLLFITPRIREDEVVGSPGEFVSPPPAQNRAQILTPIVLVGIAVLILMAGRTNRDLLLPLLSSEFGHSAQILSIVFAVTAAIEIALVVPAGHIMERFGRLAVLLPCLLAMGVAFLLAPLASGVGGLFLIGIVLSAGNGLGSGINKTLSADLTPSKDRASWLGVWNSLAGAGALVGPGLISAVTAASTVVAASMATGALSLLGAAWAVVWVPKFVPRPRRPTAGPGPETGSRPSGGLS